MKLRVALLQTDIQWGDKEKNLDSAENMIATLEDADIALLPEMFSTGFMAEDASQAESMDGRTVSWMQRIAARTGTAVAGSLAISDGSHRKPFNRFVLAAPDGTIQHYDKRHLFSFSGEDSCYTAGSERVIWNYKGFRILPMVCYDLRFPVWSRNRSDYDIAIYTASWPQSRIGVWDVLLRARAIENQCWALGVNRVGSDPSASYNGHSAAIDYCGNPLACAPSDRECVIKTELDKEELSDFRSKFRAWEDADDFTVRVGISGMRP